LYELLAGEPPFTGPTPQAVVAKRFAHPPPSVLVVRPTVPRALDETIRKAMALVPADRFATASQFAEALGSSAPAISTTAATPVAKHEFLTSPRIRTGAIAAAVIGAIVLGYLILHAPGIGSRNTLLSAGVLQQRDELLIADFESHAQDSMLGPAVTEAFRIDFGGSPVVRVTAPARVAEALARMRRPSTTRLDAALAREVAVREGIKGVVIGQVARLGAGFLLSAQLVSASSGDVLAGYRETAADSTQIIAAVDRLSGRLRERIGESLRSVRSEPPLAQVTTSSLEALWKYHEGQRLGDAEGDYVKAVSLLEEAVALDTGFATAYRTLGGFQGRLGNRAEEVAALTKAIQHQDRLTDQEREHTRAIYYHQVTGELEKELAIYQAILPRYPHDSLARNNLGVVNYLLHQPVRAESIFRAALDTVRPWSPGGHLNLSTTLVALGRRAEAERIYSQASRMFPGNRSVQLWRILLSSSAGDYAGAAAAARVYRDRQAGTSIERIGASRYMAKIAAVQGRLAEAERYTRDAMAASVDARRPAEYLKDAAVLGFTDVWFRRQRTRGLRTVETALARYPLNSMKLLDRPFLRLAIVYAAAGQSQQARALLEQYERQVSFMLRRIEDPFRRWVWGQVALAEGRYADAVAEFQAYLPTPRACLPCGQTALAQAYDGLGNLDSAIAVYERYLTTPSIYRLNEDNDQGPFNDDATQLAPALKRLGELYEQRGDRAKAREYYSRFAQVWKNADAELQPAVLEVNQRLHQLGGEGSLVR
jgi:tetratricopeptide (TPR) repeat protein